MSAFLRLIEAAAILKPVAQGVAVRQALPKIIKLVAIAITTSVIAAAVIMFVFYGIHLKLSLHGYSAEQALLVTFCVASMVLIVFILWLRKTVEEFKQAFMPKPTGVMGIVDSFLDGLKASEPEIKP